MAYHPRYHAACGALPNVNTTALDRMSDAIAHAVLQFAITTSSVNASEKASEAGATKLDYSGSRLIR